MIKVERKGSILIVYLEGQLTYTNSTEVKEEIRKNLNKEEEKLIIDLAHLEHIDSSGVGMIISLWRKMGEKNVVLTELQPKVARVFEISKIDQIIPIYSSVREALK